MSRLTDTFDVSTLQLSAGQGRRIELEIELGTFDLGGEHYGTAPSPTPAVLDVSRMTGGGHALRLRFEVSLQGPCMRCLEPAGPAFVVDTREVDQPGEGEDLDSPYLEDEDLRLAAWAHDALALAVPSTLLCRSDCRGLCAECGVNLNEADPGHHHERPPDPRWEKLSDLKLD